MNLFDLVEDPGSRQQDSAESLVQLFQSQAPCNRCSLAEVNPDNPGFIYRGNPNAKIAVLSDSPFSEDMAGQSVFCGPGRHSWIQIMKKLGLKEDDFFLTFVVQCRTDPDVVVKIRRKGRKKVQAIDPEAATRQDTLTCFNLHAFQVLKSLPNLEIIIATGKIPVQVLFKEDFQAEKHVGNFFISDFFPKVPVFVLDHPRYYDIATEFKTNQLSEDLDFFKRKYLQSRSILKIHAYYKACMERGAAVSLNHSIEG